MPNYQEMADQLAKLTERQMQVSLADLMVMQRRLGRRVPKWVRRDMRRVAEAAQLGQHPKLAARVDPDAVDAAFTRASAWLSDVDMAAIKAQARRAMWAGLAFNLMLATALVLTVLTWAGVIGGTPEPLTQNGQP